MNLRTIVPLLLLATATAFPEEGMWTFNNFPSDKVKKAYGFAPDQAWLKHARLASVRLAGGCSASFVSPNGLILTNHHCASSCLQNLSSKGQDLLQTGYYARIEGEEKRCPNTEANQLIDIANVTDNIIAATKGRADEAANEARRAEIARLEKECATSEQFRCEVVTLYQGARYELYKYRRYQDVRLVFAPELAIAFFGGDPDNFNFPRYDLDMTFLRAYDNGKPLSTPDYFTFSPKGAQRDELTFVSGHPGGTDRQLPVAMIELERDYTRPDQLLYLAEYRGLLTEFQQRGAEARRIAQNDLFRVENTLKAWRGEQEALMSKSFFAQLRQREQDFRARIQKDARLAREMGSIWNEVDKVAERRRALYKPYLYLELRWGFRSSLYGTAMQFVRLAAESQLPNEKRLEEFAEARLPQLRQELLSPAPVYKELEIEKLTFGLTKLMETLGPDDPVVRKILGRKSPREVATEAIEGTKLDQLETRRRLFEGGAAAIASFKDPLLDLARTVDPDARAIRKTYEEEVDSPLQRIGRKLGQARFAAYGDSVYPDATFTLRLSYGSVKGWKENGKDISPFTILGGAFERHTGSDPFALPESWLKNKDKLNLQTHFNFTTTNDIIGGNSGSPVINKDLQIVGLIFDGNIHSLGGNYGFDESVNRAVAVDVAAILETLDKIYGASRVLGEIQTK